MCHRLRVYAASVAPTMIAARAIVARAVFNWAIFNRAIVMWLGAMAVIGGASDGIADGPRLAINQSSDSNTHHLTALVSPPTPDNATTGDGPRETEPSNSPTPTLTIKPANFPPIPESATSFGAAVARGSLFVYGGHLGDAHSYDNTSQGETLWRLRLNDPPNDSDATWQRCLTGPPTQGLAMVATGGSLYRIGGFTARNPPDTEHDLWSGSEVNRIDVAALDNAADPAKIQWMDAPSLPEGRSSFDAAVVNGEIYVVGGWTLAGSADTKWLETAYRFDPNTPDDGWRRIADPPFRRRALSCAAHDGRLYAIGGMLPGSDNDENDRGGPTTRVTVYDPQTDAWSEGPSLIGEAMAGFGSSAFATGGRLYVTAYDGSIQRLSRDGTKWETIATMDNARFFHRMVPIGENRLIVVGGASMQSGKFDQIELIELR